MAAGAGHQSIVTRDHGPVAHPQTSRSSPISDHGKSTLADRILELTHTVSGARRCAPPQVLDSMDLERGARHHDQGAGPLRVFFNAPDGQTYQLHLIDTPGHVDFTYEVSRFARRPARGALLVVDAAAGRRGTDGRQHLPRRSSPDLELIPCLNKIDLPGAET